MMTVRNCWLVAALLAAGSVLTPAIADDGPTGQYASRNGMMKLSFLPDGKVHVGSAGGGGDGNYVVDGTSLTLKVNGKEFPLTLVDEDTIAVEHGPTLHRDREYACKDESGDIGHVLLTASGKVQLLDPTSATDKGPHDFGTYTEEGTSITIKDSEDSIVYTRTGRTLTSGKITCSRF